MFVDTHDSWQIVDTLCDLVERAERAEREAAEWKERCILDAAENEGRLAELERRIAFRERRAQRERDNLTARLRGTEQAGRELLTTAEGLLGDRERAMEADRHRIRADDAEARVAEHERVRREVAEELRGSWARGHVVSVVLSARLDRLASRLAPGDGA